MSPELPELPCDSRFDQVPSLVRRASWAYDSPMDTGNTGSPSSHRFEAPRSAIDTAVRRLKAHGNVAPDAVFSPDAAGGLRSEIAYHDADFLWYLGRSEPSVEIEIVQSAIRFLSEHGHCSPDFVVDEAVFQAFRKSIREHFTGGWTSFTPVMERLFYTLTAIRQPSRLVELGCYWGNTLAWFAGPALGPDKLYTAQSVVGIDIDAKAIEAAKSNFRKIGAEDDVQLIAADTREAAVNIECTSRVKSCAAALASSGLGKLRIWHRKLLLCTLLSKGGCRAGSSFGFRSRLQVDLAIGPLCPETEPSSHLQGPDVVGEATPTERLSALPSFPCKKS